MWYSPRGPSVRNRAISFLLWILIDVLPPVAGAWLYINITS
jgi:hypothetical protein